MVSNFQNRRLRRTFYKNPYVIAYYIISHRMLSSSNGGILAQALTERTRWRSMEPAAAALIPPDLEPEELTLLQKLQDGGLFRWGTNVISLLGTFERCLFPQHSRSANFQSFVSAFSRAGVVNKQCVVRELWSICPRFFVMGRVLCASAGKVNFSSIMRFTKSKPSILPHYCTE